MRLTKRRIERAKRIVAKANELELKNKMIEEAELKAYNAALISHKNLIADFRNRLTDKLANEWSERFPPKFEIGEEVKINPCAPRNSWEGTFASYLKQIKALVDFSKPVKITARYLDVSYLRDLLENGMEQVNYKMLENIFCEGDFRLYEKAWEDYNSKRLEAHGFSILSYSYKVELEIPNVSGFREPNFMKVGSTEDMVIAEYIRLKQEIEKIHEEKINLKKRKFLLEKEMNLMGRDYPEMNLSYVVNFSKTVEEYLEKWGNW